jgi:hypothetical protein
MVSLIDALIHPAATRRAPIPAEESALIRIRAGCTNPALFYAWRDHDDNARARDDP